MYRITREIGFSYGHRLHRYEGKCSRLHGHNGRLQITLEAGDLDEAGMVLDFVDVKRVMTRWLDETLDHRMILHREDPAVGPLQLAGEDLYIVEFSPTAENLARHIFNHLKDLGLPVVEVFLRETDSCAASYSPRRDPAA